MRFGRRDLLVLVAVVLVVVATIVVTIPIRWECIEGGFGGPPLACPPPPALFIRDFSALVGYVAALILIIVWLVRIRSHRV